MIAGGEVLDFGYRVAASQLLLLAISEIFPDLAGTLDNWRMSQFIHYGWEKPLLFMLILVEHDERSFSDQYKWGHYINSTVDKRFFNYINLLHITIAYCVLIALQYELHM